MTAPEVAIVPMLAGHIEAVMPYEREMFGTEAWTANGYRTELADVARRYYLAAEAADGSVLGWAGLLVVGESAEILTVGVVPAARRRGIARALLNGLIEEATRREVCTSPTVSSRWACGRATTTADEWLRW